MSAWLNIVWPLVTYVGGYVLGIHMGRRNPKK